MRMINSSISITENLKYSRWNLLLILILLRLQFFFDKSSKKLYKKIKKEG